MKIIKAHLVAGTIILSMLFLSIPVYALSYEFAEPVVIEPFWDNVDRINMSLSSSGSTAFCDVTIRGRSGATHISATITLARVNPNGTRTIVRTWSASSASSSLAFTGSNVINSGSTYRLTVSARVTRNGFTELVTDWIERRL